MKHIGDSLLSLPVILSREHILATRGIAICNDFLKITLSYKNIQVTSTSMRIIHISHSEKQLILSEIPNLLGYINDNSYNFSVRNIIVV